MQAPDHRDLRHRSASGGISRRLLRDTRTMTDCLRLTGYALQEVLNLIGWTLATVFSILGLGRVAPAFEAMRRASERQRAWASERLGRRLIARYERSEPAPGTRGLAQLGAELQDPSRARDLDWHLVNPAASLASTALLLGIAVNGASMLLVSLAVIPDGDFYHWGYFVSWHDPTGAAWFLLGLAQLMAAPVLARLLQRVHARWVSFMLATGTSDSLEERVAALTATRKTALELQEAEIRRIERDLHDGAQARLVTMGMTLTQASRLLEHDPAAAKAMLDSAKDDSSAALKELRTLVRGIRPPILADRGLVEAVRSLAAGSPIDTRVVSTLQERLVPTVETAVYFVVAELLANAVKHSAATEIVVELDLEGDVITARVTDNGIGGAVERDGGGLAGVRQRLAPFDGWVEFVSPVGGPTVVTARVPRPAD